MFFEDILTSARLAREYVAGLSYDDFQANIEKQDAVVRRLEVIWEAAGHLAAETRADLTEVPWRKIKAMRNLMVHRYWAIDPERVWIVVRDELPPLIAAIEEHLHE